MVKCHDNHNHQSRDGTLYTIKKNKYHWNNMSLDAMNYIKNCVVCAKVQNINKNKKEKCKIILSHGPKDRYVADLWYIPDNLIGKTNYKYILDVCM